MTNRTSSELIAYLNRRVAENNRTINPAHLRGLRGAFVGQLVSIFGDEGRHILLAAIFPETKGSTKGLTGAQVSTLLQWLGFAELADEQGRGTGTRTATRQTEIAREEGNRTIVEYRLAKGQIELPIK